MFFFIDINFLHDIFSYVPQFLHQFKYSHDIGAAQVERNNLIIANHTLAAPTSIDLERKHVSKQVYGHLDAELHLFFCFLFKKV